MSSNKETRAARGESQLEKVARMEDKGTNEPLATRLASLRRTLDSVSMIKVSYSSRNIRSRVELRAVMYLEREWDSFAHDVFILRYRKAMRPRDSMHCFSPGCRSGAKDGCNV
jgi:hypothetical protein